jgi:Bacterial regulatory proteins, luxR family
MRGFSNPEIAILLRVSPNTVRNHLVNIFRKADVSSRTELVFMMVAAPEQARHARYRGGLSPWYAFLAQGSLDQRRSGQ